MKTKKTFQPVIFFNSVYVRNYNECFDDRIYW